MNIRECTHFEASLDKVMSGHNEIKLQDGGLQMLGKVSLYVVDTQVIWWYLIEHVQYIGLSFIDFSANDFYVTCMSLIHQVRLAAGFE